ncbi:hypothetical protein LP421_13120 [Rhizobium sp. RCAM05350]|nr:hypothetical protein LP421_13120 [Rhizobium sp. RCAM05350]
MTFTPTGAAAPMTWAQSLSANYTDGIVVLHKGKVVYERYSGCLDEADQHGAMSVTKSLTGLMGEMLVAVASSMKRQRSRRSCRNCRPARLAMQRYARCSI